MDPSLSRRMERFKEDLDTTMRLFAEVEELEDKHSYIAECENIFAQFIDVKELANNHLRGLRAAETKSTVEEFDATLEKEVNREIPSARSNPEFKEFMSNIRIYFTATDSTNAGPIRTVDGDIEMEEELQTIDPITKQPLKNPVKNKICGHVYERATVNEAIELNKRMRCPTLGCSNQQFVQKEHLEEDRALFMKLRIMRQQEKEAKQMEEYDSDYADED